MSKDRNLLRGDIVSIPNSFELILPVQNDKEDPSEFGGVFFTDGLVADVQTYIVNEEGRGQAHVGRGFEVDLDRLALV